MFLRTLAARPLPLPTQTQALGWLGAACFALSGAPEAVQSVIRGRSDLASGTVALWLVGESAMLAYARRRYPRDWVLTANYAANLLLVSVIAYYRWFA